MATSAKEYSMLFSLSAQLGKEFNPTFSTAQKSLNDTQKAIKALGKAQSDITAYQKTQQSVEATQKKLDGLKQMYDNIQREIQETGTYSSALENKLLSKQLAIDKTSDALTRQTQKLAEQKQALRDAGVDTDNLANESKRLAAEMDKLADEQAQVAESAGELGERGSGAFLALGDALVDAGILVALQKIASAYIDCVKGAASFADEIGTVSAQYGIAEEDLQAYYYAAELVDVSADTLTRSMAKQIKSMKAAQDGTKLYTEAYEKLGVEVLNADGTLRDADAVYWEVIDRLGQMANETERDAIAQQILGRSAMELNTLIKAGSGVVREYAEEARNAGYVMSDEMLASAMALDDEMQRSKSGMLALKNSIGVAFAPELRKLIQVWNGFLAGLTKFTQKHPVIVKSIIAIAAEIGTLLIVTKGYKLVKNALNMVKAVNNALKAKSVALTAADTAATAAHTGATVTQTAATGAQTAAQHGLNAAMAANPIGAVIAGVALLTTGIIALCHASNKESEAAKRAREEQEANIAAYNDAMKAYDSHIQSNDSAIAKIELEAESIESLIWELGRLEQATEKTVEQKKRMLDLVTLLNGSFPELGLSYNDFSDTLNMTAENIQKVVAAEIDKKKFDQIKQAYQQNLEDKAKLWRQYMLALYHKRQAEEIRGTESEPTGIEIEYWTKLTEEIIPKYEEEIENLGDKIDAASDYEDRLLENMGIYGEKIAQMAAIDKAAGDAAITIEDLCKSYEKVKEAAKSSIEGQYELWDTAAVVVPMDVDKINTSLETQQAYWRDYSTDLDNLTGRNIEGLSEMIASFGNGSKDSVNAVAGMVEKSDEELRKMVKNWQDLREEQKTAYNKLTDFQFDLQRKAKEITQGFDLSDDAKTAAESTMDSYIQGIKDGTVDAAEAAKAVRNAVIAALQKDLPPPREPKKDNLEEWYQVFADEDYYPPTTDYPLDDVPDGYASGTRNALPGLAYVGERGPELINFAGGETVYTAEETKRLMRLYDAARQSPVAAERAEVQAFTITVAPTFTVNGDAGGNMETQLRSFAAELIGEVKEALEEASDDVRRGVYA